MEKKKYIKVFIIVIFLILLVGTLGIVSALTSYEKDTASKITDIFAKLKYLNEKGFYIFTSWGQENGCSVYPDWSGWIKGSATWSSLPSSVSCSKVSGVFSGSDKCAIDIWYDNTIYASNSGGPPSSVNYNNWLKEVAGTGVSFSSTARPYYFVEVYACPSTPPTIEEHDTKVYVCQQGIWSSKGTYEKDESCSWDTSGTNRCWCSDEDDNFYVDSYGGVHCRESTYSSVTDGTWCPSSGITPTCSDGIQNQGETGIDCGGPCNACGGGIPPTNLDAIIYNIETPLQVNPGDSVIVKFDVKNKGDTGDYLIETGIIPKSVAKDWGFEYAGGGFGIFDWLTQTSTECCPNQPNVFAKTTNLKSGEIDSFTIKIPQAPYSEIGDLCYNNKYWNGTGEYILYIIVKTGCYPEGKSVAYETRLINIGASNTTSGYTATQISLTKKDLDEATASTIMSSTCSLSSNCLPYESLTGNKNYSVSCKSTAITKQKIEEASKEVCKEKYSLFNFKFLTSASAAICAGSLAISIVTAGAATPITATICATTIVGAVTIGSTQVALESGCEIFKQKGAQGICIATEKGGDLCSFFEKTAWFSITGDSCTDGAIIMIGLILLGIIIFSRMAGIYGRFEYDK